MPLIQLKDLNDLSVDDIKTHILTLSPDCTHLDLAEGIFGKKSSAELLTIFSAIISRLPQLTLINLGDNFFKNDELAQILKILPPNITVTLNPQKAINRQQDQHALELLILIKLDELFEQIISLEDRSNKTQSSAAKILLIELLRAKESFLASNKKIGEAALIFQANVVEAAHKAQLVLNNDPQWHDLLKTLEKPVGSYNPYIKTSSTFFSSEKPTSEAAFQLIELTKLKKSHCLHTLPYLM